MNENFLDEKPSENTPKGSEPISLINPASGLPMLAGSMLDIEGNPYGSDLHDCWSEDFWPDDV